MAKQEKSAAELYREERKARLAKAAKKNQKKSISSSASKTVGKAIAVLLVIALIGGICGFAVDQSGVIQRSKTAFTVGGVEVSQPEYSYYYISMYNNVAYYAQMYSYYGQDIGFQTNVDPAEQQYSGMMGEIEDFPEDKTPTWADYLEHGAKHQIQQVKALVAEAGKLGITLDDEAKAAVQKNIDELDEQAAGAASEDGSSRFSLSAFLRYCYGKGVSKSLFTKILEEQQLATMVQEHKEEELKKGYTDKQINAEYKENIQNYAVVTLRNYSFAAEQKTTGEGDSATQAVTDETMAAAKKLAEAFASGAHDEESFKNLASEAAKDADDKAYKDYLTDDSKTLTENVSYSTLSQSASDSDFLKWAFSADTEKNSTYVVENASTGYTVYMMVDALHKTPDTKTFDSRHILVNYVKDEQDTSGESTAETTASADETTAEAATTTEAATTAAAKKEVKIEPLDLTKYPDVTIDLGIDGEKAANKEGYKKAQDILEEYLKGEKTAAAFGALAEKYSEDSGSKDNGGLYENTELGNFVKPYEDWCMKEGRKEGDVGIVEVESTNYSGYHIIYFIGTNDVTWKDAVREALAHEDLEEYVEEAAHSDAAKLENESESVAQAVTNNLNTLIKRQNRNASANANSADEHDH